jgi:hypothetical protein
MTSLLDALRLILPGLVPILFFIWIGLALTEVAELVIAEWRGRLSVRPIPFLAWRWVGNSCWLTIVIIVMDAYYRSLISLVSCGLAIVVTLLAVIGASWFLNRQYPEAKGENDAPPAAER